MAGAHSALSARIAEEAGFDGIWVSGFEIATSNLMPDANVLTMTKVLNATNNIDEKVSIPVIADCDNGYGDAINLVRTVQAFERAGISGISIEDSAFPKRCSLYTKTEHRIQSVDESINKIKVAVSIRKNKDFAIIARTEAMIAGLGIEEALLRARAYVCNIYVHDLIKYI